MTKSTNFVDRWRKNPENRDARLWSALDRPGGVGSALVVANFFHPRLIEIDGCVLLAENYDGDIFSRWREQLGTARARIEEMMNLVNIADLFINDSEATAEELDELARTVGRHWRSALSDQFPGREFTIGVTTSDVNPDGPEITFYSAG